MVESYSQMNPEQKLNLVQDKKRKGETILFVGDGINDAAAMAASDLSIAVGRESLTREVADIEWLVPDLSFAKAISLSRQTVRLIHSNLTFALCYNIVGIAIAAAGFIHPVVAALLHDHIQLRSNISFASTSRRQWPVMRWAERLWGRLVAAVFCRRSCSQACSDVPLTIGAISRRRDMFHAARVLFLAMAALFEFSCGHAADHVRVRWFGNAAGNANAEPRGPSGE